MQMSDFRSSDATLVEEALGGRKESFSLLVQRHQNAVYNLAYRWSWNRDDAADIAQDTFIRAFGKLGLYKPQYPFRTWVLTICANLAKNRFRSDERRRRAQETHLELYPQQGADPRESVLEDALGAIAEAQRVPLILKHVEGLSYGEIAAVLGINVSAAKMRVKRARDELVKIIGPSPLERTP